MIPLAEPNIGHVEKDYVLDALESGWINTTGPYITKFQDAMARRLEAERTVAIANGTSGLFMALKALGIGPGDKVLVPTITFVASVNAIIHVGAEPVFFDCDEYLNLNVMHLRSYLESGPKNVKAIMPVHMFGHPCNMKVINSLAREYNLVVVEDACEAIGSRSNDGLCGSSGDIGVLSFSFNKMITSGNGGMVVTNSHEIADKIRYWITQSKDDPVNYIHNEVGYNLGLTNIQAALGYAQLTRIDEFLSAKLNILERYKYRLNTNKLLPTPSYAEHSNSWFLGYNSNNKHRLMKTLADNNIESRPLFTPNHTHKPFRKFKTYGGLMASKYYANRIVNLPCSTTLTVEQIDKVCDIINSIE